jgi:NADPH:quinone reductase-like Zn-dependent oxidoreductase
MKAIVCPKYGSPDVLQFKEVATPVPKTNEVLVKVHAASLNAADFETMRGVFIVRMVAPFRPFHRILGTDIAGRVEAVGNAVTQFRPGDEVWADLAAHGWGALAEYVCVPEEALRPKPESMTFEEAAAYPQAAVLALQNLQGVRSASPTPIALDMGPVEPGQKVLINGAGGGVGTFAVQLAKYFGAEVTGVDSAKKLDMLRSIGADHVIDYTQEDFTKNGQQYDLILGVVANRSIYDYRRALSSEGTFVYVGGTTSAIFQSLILGPLISRRSTQKMGIVLGQPNNKEDMDFLAELFEAGNVVPVIDRNYPLSETPEAMRYLENGHALGKVVINVGQD